MDVVSVLWCGVHFHNDYLQFRCIPRDNSCFKIINALFAK